MKNSRFLLLTSCLVVLPMFAFGQQDAVDKFQTPLPDTTTGEWWRSSWQNGYRYQSEAKFTLYCDTKFTAAGKPRWLDSIAQSEASAGAHLVLGGDAHASTFVVEGSPEPLLIRYYESIHVDRKMGGEMDWAKDGTTYQMHQWLFKGKGISKIIDDAINWITATVIEYYSGVPVPAKAVKVTGVGESFGDTAQAALEDELKDKGLGVKDGGFEIQPGSKAFKSLSFAKELEGVNNLAVQLTEDFRNRVLVMDQQKGLLYLHDATVAADELQGAMLNSSAVRKLIGRLPTPKSDRVKAVLQRETLAMNSEIYDGKTRQVGECWVIDGAILSSILHPDLKGRFTGQVILCRGDDLPFRKTNAGGDYHAQVLHVVPQAVINGHPVQSNLQYKESKFNAKMNEQIDAYIYVDQDNAMIREALIDFSTDGTAQVLPAMVITSGLEAAGKVRLHIEYVATRKLIAPTKK